MSRLSGDDETTKYGIIETIDENISGFLEKPEKTETASRSACPCFYFFGVNVFGHLDNFLEILKMSKIPDFIQSGNCGKLTNAI